MNVSPLTAAKVELNAARWAFAQIPTESFRQRVEAAEAAVRKLEAGAR